MAITTYTAGEILTAASLNNNFASGGLQFISATTIGTTVASVTVSAAFSTTYDNYKIVVSGGTNSTDNVVLALQLGATVTGYYAAYTGVTYSTAAALLAADNNAANFARPGNAKTNGLFLNIDLISPFLAKNTFFNAGATVSNTSTRLCAGYLDNTTSYTAFTLTPAFGTMTGGTVRVYGYTNS